MENKYYFGFVLPLIFGILFILLFFLWGGFNGDKLNQITLFIGIIGLIYSVLSFFIMKRKSGKNY